MRLRIKTKVRLLKRFLTRDIWRVTEDEVSRMKYLMYNTTKVLLLSVQRFSDDRIVNKASALTYNTLLSIVHTGSDLALAVEGQQQMGAAVLNLDLEYRWPVVPPELADLLLAHTDWYVHPGDDRVDMISQVTFDQERSDAPPHHHVHRARRA